MKRGVFSRRRREKYGEQRKLSGVYWDVHRARKVDNAVELNSYIHVLNEYKTVPLFNCLTSLVHIHPPRHAAAEICLSCFFLSPLVSLCLSLHHKKICSLSLLVLCSHDE